MKHILLTATLTLAACGPHIYVKETPYAEMDRADRAVADDHAPDHSGDDGDNGAGSASSDAVSDDSNGDGSDD